jgi:hypothetical protein
MWVYQTQQVLLDDFQRWSKFNEHGLPHEFINLAGFPVAELRCLFLVNRFQSMVTTMQFLRLTSDTILGYFDKVSALYNLAAANIDVKTSLSSAFIAWVVKVAVQLMERSGDVMFVPALVSDLINKCVDGRLVDMPGYSPLQELILCVAERHALLCSAEDSDNNAWDASFSSCVCGGELSAWRPMGMELPSDVSTDAEHLVKVPRVLCELCFRQLYSNPLRTDGVHVAVQVCTVLLIHYAKHGLSIILYVVSCSSASCPK